MHDSPRTEPPGVIAAVTRRFTRAQRILRTSEFEQVMRGGRRQHHRLCVIYHRANDRGHARLGIAVGRRVSPHAVDRNTIKRLVRECFRHVSAELPSLDIAVVARPAARTVPRSALRAELRAAFEQLSRRPASTGGAPLPGPA